MCLCLALLSICYSGPSVSFADTTLTVSGDGEITNDLVKNVSSKAKTVIIGSDITSIGDKCFQYFYYLTNLVINEDSKLQTIGSNAFYYTAINNFTAPKQLTKIGNQAFYSCLNQVTLNDKITDIEGVFQYSYITAIEIPSQIKNISANAFKSCRKLTSVELKEGVEYISENSFYGTSALTSIKIPKSVKTIFDSAFAQSGIQNIEFTSDSQLEYIGNFAFKSSQIQTISFPSKITTIPSSAFQLCSKLSSVTLNEGITSIKSNAFYITKSLISINIPSSVEEISSSAFYGSALQTVTFSGDSKLKVIGEYAFQQTSIQSITVPSITNISKAAFKFCDKLTTVTLSEGITYINSEAFYKTKALTTINIPSSVVEIGNYAFTNSAIQKITFSENSKLETIGNYAFSDTSKLDSIAFPKSLKHLGKYCFSSDSLIFSPTSIISTVELNEGLETIGFSCFYSVKTLVNINFPSTLKNIGDYAFDGTSVSQFDFSKSKITSVTSYMLANNQNITAVKLPNTVKTIEEYAFYSNMIQKIELPDSLESIGNYAFKNNGNLKEVIFKATSKLRSIGKGAFSNCKALTGFVFHKNVEALGDSAFSDCSLLKDIYYYGSHVFSQANYSDQFLNTQVEKVYVTNDYKSETFYSFSIERVSPPTPEPTEVPTYEPTSQPSSGPSDAPSDDKSKSTKVTIAAASSSIIVVIAISVVVYFVIRRKRNTDKNGESQALESYTNGLLNTNDNNK